MATLLTVQHLAKRYGTRQVLDDVSFVVDDGDRIALVGVNGAGKSTLLRFLAADDVTVGRDNGPDAGLITRRRGLTIEYVAQEPALDPDQTVGVTLREGLRGHAEAIAALARVDARLTALAEAGTDAGAELDASLEAQAHLHERIAALGGWDQDHEIRGLSAALAIPPETARVGALSMGERRRVALARALLARPELLALDEPTNHLDAATTEWLEQRLIERGGALLLVTHDRYFLDRVATRIIELDRGRIHGHDGGYREFLARQAERWSTEDEGRRQRAAFVRRELGWIRRRAPARPTKQKARIDRFDAAVDAGTEELDRTPPAVLRLGSGSRLGGTILELLEASKRAPDGRVLFEDLTVRWKHGDRIGVVGVNGAGKTTLIRAILGQQPLDAGRVVVGQNTRFAFMDQARTSLDDAHTVLEEIAGDDEEIALADGSVHVRTFLRMLLFEDSLADAKVGVLSGGERNRVQLAKLLRDAGNFLILDEPTNDLDVLTLGVLEETLAQYAGCALIVSHDRWFLDKVATGILAFEGDGRVVFYEGSCTDYLDKRAARAEAAAAALAAAAAPATSKAAAPAPAPARARKRTFKERQELAGMEGAIAAAEAEVARREAELADPDLYARRGAEVPALTAGLGAARAEVERLFARWAELDALPE